MIWEIPKLNHLVHLPRFDTTPQPLQEIFDDLAIDYLYEGIHIGGYLAQQKQHEKIMIQLEENIKLMNEKLKKDGD